MTVKELFLKMYSSVSNIEELTNNQLTVVTPVGIMWGTVCIEDDKSNSSVQNDFLQIHNESRKFADQHNVDGNIDTSVIPLKDVTLLMSNNHEVHFEYLSLFADQIIGVTLSVKNI